MPEFKKKNITLFIQIPCYNEEHTLPTTLAELPKSIEGVDAIKVLIVDDGSIDNTIEIAKQHGVDYIVRNKQNMGLAKTFSKGIESCLALGADIIVNTDGDNQYCAADLPKLAEPIVKQKSDIVIGCRQMSEIDDFSWAKKKLQKFGSFVVSKFAGANIEDTTSGYRAYSRKAAMSICVVGSFTYTLETIIQAGRRRVPMTTVPVRTNRKTRESRLFKSSFEYIRRSIASILLVSTQLRPIKTFGFIGGVSILAGTAIGVRFLYYLIESGGDFAGTSGHVQSLILSAIFILFGSTSFLVGLVADQIGANRALLEETFTQNRISAYSRVYDAQDVDGLVYARNA